MIVDRAGLGSVLDRVVEQVDENLLDEQGIERHQRQVGRQVDVDTALAQVLLDARQRAPDDLLQGVPVLADADAAGLEARHLEEVVHEPVQAIGLLLDRLGQLPPRAASSSASWSTRALADPVIVASGVRRS